MKSFKVQQAYLALIMLILSVFLITGCGGSGGDVPGVADTTPPTVISTAPAAGATGVPTDRKIIATFSEAMLTSTITVVGTFTVHDDTASANVSGTPTYNAINHIATFTPAAPLTASHNFTATITTAAKDSAGNALAVAKTWVFSSGAGTDTTHPTVSITSPIDGAVGVLRNANITATFSEVMDPATITQITFTVKKTSDSSAVAGTVTYLGSTATFHPTSNFADTIQYTATITTVATDLAGNALIGGGATNPWSFTTGAVAGGNPRAPVLGEAGRFVILASQTITTTPGSAISNGDLGVMDQARSYNAVGFTNSGSAGQLAELTNGLSYGIDDANPLPFPYPLHYATLPVGAAWATTAAMLTQSKTDLGIANTFLATDPNPDAPTQVCPIQLGNLTLTRGVYKTAANVEITTGDIYLDTEGDSTSVWIFSIDGTLTTGAPGGNIILANGALAKNIYWRTGGITTIGPGTAFYGNVFAWTQVNVLAGADITGRLFALTDQVTLISDTVTKAP